MGRNACTAAPSSHGIGGEAWPSRASASPATGDRLVDAVADGGELLRASRASAPSQSRMTGRARLVLEAFAAAR